MAGYYAPLPQICHVGETVHAGGRRFGEARLPLLSSTLINEKSAKHVGDSFFFLLVSLFSVCMYAVDEDDEEFRKCD